LLNCPYYLREYNNNNRNNKNNNNNNNNNKLSQPGTDKETTYTFLGSEAFPEIEGFMFSTGVKPFLHVTIYNTSSTYPASCLT
jgi:hypothetical protein